MKGFTIILAGLFLCSCTKPPAMPQLPSYPSEFDDIVLRETVTPEDIKHIFHVLNRNGRLDALKPYLEDLPDSELEPLLGVANRQVFQEIGSDRGLIPALQTSIKQQTFSKWAKFSDQAVRDPSYRDKAEVILAILASPDLSALATRDSKWVDPEWTSVFGAALASADQEYLEKSLPRPTAEPVPASMLFQDGQRLLNSPELRKGLVDLGKTFEKAELAIPVLRSTSFLRAEQGTRVFEGFGAGIAQMAGHRFPKPILDRRNQLDLFFQLKQEADAPSDGLFREIQEPLQRNIGELGKAFQPLIPHAAFGYLKTKLTASKNTNKQFWLDLVPPKPNQLGKSFVSFFIAARDAILTATGRGQPNPNEWMTNLSLYLDAYATTKWAERLAIDNQDAWRKLETAGFENKIWETSITPSSFELNLIEDSAKVGHTQLTEKAAAELQSILGNNFVAALQNLVDQPDSGNFSYDFSLVTGINLSTAMASALEIIDGTRPIGDASVGIGLLISQLTQTNASGHTLLDDFETDNLLSVFQQFAGGLTPSGWKTLRNWLFESLSTGAIPVQTRQQIISLYDGKTEIANRAARLLDSLPMLYQFDVPTAGLPSPFTLYHRLLNSTDPEQKKALGSLLGYLGKSHFASLELKEGKLTPTFPAVSGLIKDSGNLAHLFHYLSWLPESFGQTLSEMFAEGGLETHLKLLTAVMRDNPRGVQAWMQTQWSADLSFPKEARQWLYRFVRSPDFPILCTFLQSRTFRADMLKLVVELKTLAQKGELREAFQLLGFLRSDRMHGLSRFLLDWERSGELGKLLTAVETLLRPLPLD